MNTLDKDFELPVLFDEELEKMQDRILEMLRMQ